MLENTLKELKAQLKKIHNGYYPKDILLSLGKDGLYKDFLKDKEEGLTQVIKNIAKISKVCGNTGFCVWCQEALLWYLLNTKKDSLKDIFQALSCGEILGGTGLSNPIKAFAGIENHKMSATKTKGGVLLNGTLPWVSNISHSHYFASIVECEKEFMLVLIHCDERVKLTQSTEFCALDGSGTLSISLKDYFLEEKFILATNALEVLPKILPGFVLLQCAIALGLIECALEEASKTQKDKNGINAYLPNSIEEMNEAKDRLCERLFILAKEPKEHIFKQCLQLKLDFIDLALKASNHCMLSLGTKGYMKDSLGSKLLLETYFVAIVTPSSKHIYKLLSAL